jgi:hypothetical protein
MFNIFFLSFQCSPWSMKLCNVLFVVNPKAF